MSEVVLKKGWTRVAFGDVVRQVQDRVDPHESGLERFVAGEHMDTDELCIRRWGTIGAGYLGPAFHMRFKPGQVLYGSRRTYLRKVAVADFEGITANTTFVIESRDPKVLLPEVLPFIMQTNSFHEHSKKQSKGSVNPYVNFSDLSRYEFALPPLAEQRRIAMLLTAVEGQYGAANATLHAALNVYRSYQTQLFEASKTRVPLGDVVTFLTSGSRGWAKYYSGTGDIFVRLGNLSGRGAIDLRLSELQHVCPPKGMEAQRTRVRSGDVLLGITGEAGLGLIGFSEGLEVPAYISQHIALIRVDALKAHSAFVAYMLASAPGQRQIARFNQPTAKAGLTLDSVRALEIPALSLPQQEHSVLRLSEMARVCRSLAQRGTDALAVKEAALASLLTPNEGQA